MNTKYVNKSVYHYCTNVVLYRSTRFTDKYAMFAIKKTVLQPVVTSTLLTTVASIFSCARI